MNIISPDSLVVAVKLGHMLVNCRSKSSLCLDILDEIEYTYTWTNDLSMLPDRSGRVRALRYVSICHDLLETSSNTWDKKIQKA